MKGYFYYSLPFSYTFMETVLKTLCSIKAPFVTSMYSEKRALPILFYSMLQACTNFLQM